LACLTDEGERSWPAWQARQRQVGVGCAREAGAVLRLARPTRAPASVSEPTGVRAFRPRQIARVYERQAGRPSGERSRSVAKNTRREARKSQAL